MVAMYTIAGRQVGSHVLAMITLGTTFGGAALAMRGGEKKDNSSPPINAKDKDEENFVQKFIKGEEAKKSKA